MKNLRPIVLVTIACLTIASPFVPPAGAVAVNAGGAAAGAFAADAFFSGGLTGHTLSTFNLSGTTNPAPQAVYQSIRFGTFTYSFTGLTPGASFLVRLHFADSFYTTPGRRMFNVAINGTPVMIDFDIVLAAGGIRRAVVREFVAPVTGGTIVVAFTPGAVGSPQVCGVELLAAPDFDLTVAPDALQVIPGATAAANVAVAPANGFTAAVAFAISGLPAGASGTFTPNPLVQGTTSVLTITTSASASLGAYPVVISATSGSLSHTTNMTLAVVASQGPPADTVAVNAGGAAAGAFAADAFFSGGLTGHTTSTFNLSGTTNPAPQAVYQSIRFGTFTYSFTGLTPGASFLVRLHFADSFYTTAGRRMFNVAINGTPVMTNFDIVLAAGGIRRAVVREFVAPVTGGTIVVAFTPGAVGSPQVSGIELLPTAVPPPDDFACTELIGFSQTLMWFETPEFQQQVDDARWQMRFRASGDVDLWADPNADAWSAPVSTTCAGAGSPVLCTPCAQNSSTPDRVIFTITLQTYESDVSVWVEKIRAAIATIRTRHPEVQQIVLQSIVGGPMHALCPVTALESVRASFNHPYIDQAIALVVTDSPDLVAGISPEVQSCSDYEDAVGHLTTPGRAFVGEEIGQYYAQ